MKKCYILVLAVLAIACSRYDASPLLQRMDLLEERIAALTETLDMMNQDAAALTALVDAFKNGKTVADVVTMYSGDVLTGYKVTLTDGSSFVIRNGLDGSDGYIARDGVDGHTPVLGVVMKEDGRYYWTVDGVLLTDASGNAIPASPDPSESKVKDGTTPVISVVDGKWVVTIDGTSTVVGTVADSDALVVDGVFRSTTQTDSDVTFTLSDGTVITLPKAMTYSVSLTVAGTYVLTYSVSGSTQTNSVDVICEKGWSATVTAATPSTGTITIASDADPVDASFMVLCSDEAHNAATSFRIIDGTITLL